MKFQDALIMTFAFLLGCSPLPVKLTQASLTEITYEVSSDSLNFTFSNPLDCPLRISAETPIQILQDKIDHNFPVVIGPKKDTILSYANNLSKEKIALKMSASLGNPNDPIYIKEMRLPFKNGIKYKIIQGYNGSYSHSSEYSKHAIDFNLSEGDTICASADGFVVGVIEGYTEGGKSKRWRDYANFITIFHPEMNLFTQYVHLTYEGSFVKVGDYVKSEQAIGLAGKTGHADMEHLHFNVLKSNVSGMESTKIDFQEGYRGADLKRGDTVEK